MKEQLRRINELGLWDFQMARMPDGTVLILGSNDFSYSHYLELEFHNVTFCDLPSEFSHPVPTERGGG